MAVRELLKMGHPHLRRVAQPVPEAMLGTPEFADLLTDMGDTLKEAGGIGLAAPQIDVDLRLAIIDIPGGPSRYGDIPAMPLTAFINPQITVLDDTSAGYWEGCLSVPGLRGFVERPQHVHVAYTNLEGGSEELTLQGFLATVFQHEFDHLDGRLYIDRITDTERLTFEEEYLQFWD